jgi:hypothetical protein
LIFFIEKYWAHVIVVKELNRLCDNLIVFDLAQ